MLLLMITIPCLRGMTFLIEDEMERNTRILKESAKSDWKRIIRSQPEVFDMTIDGKTRECYYEGKNIICE